MRLESVTAELRPRSEWESVDLGLALVRRDFAKLSAAWWIGMLPVLLIALPLLRDHPFWFSLLFWWWIPVSSRLTLFKLSRILFGEDPKMKHLWKELPKAIGRRFFFRMIWARASPWRPLTMPVEDLEGLKGKDYSARCRILLRRGDSSVIMLAMWRLFLTFWLALALFFTGMLFLPQNAQAEWGEAMSLWWEVEGLVPPLGLSVAIMLSLCVSMWLVDMFSVGAGFGIYINHRTWIEGWDVELAFRRMANRLQGMAGAILVGVIGWMVTPAQAEESESKVVIEEVLAHEDFEIHTETIKEPEPWRWEWLEKLFGGGVGSAGGTGMDALAALLKFLVIGGLIGLVAWLIWKYRHLFAGRGGTRAPKAQARAKVVMGMEVTEESLPDDVAVAAMEAWRSGRRQEAMSLLYRGAISWMIGKGGVEIAESDTENDCLGRVKTSQVLHQEYFGSLTTEWIRLAYARQIPSDETIESLCRNWPFRERGAA
ncbi:hypothetical protein JIN81_12025 [Haloferula rosea]|uniref:DUF4129 domain-containing protein n=1 Tax=Haloferula rosea TaxID=490093 RepID=A0A934VGN3_9BACT|nr:hypothetical protein [Haloferula rosea]